MKEFIEKIFTDKDGNPSSKRVIGIAIIITATVFTALNVGSENLVETMFYGGFIAVGVTAFERKSL